jgi:hypothetical protein
MVSHIDSVLGWDIRPTTRTTHCASCVRLERENKSQIEIRDLDAPMHACEGTQKGEHCEQTEHPPRQSSCRQITHVKG